MTVALHPALAELCLDHADPEDNVECSGPVLERRSVTGVTTAIRCAAHDDAYRDRAEAALARIDRDYPDSAIAPAWFDPTYAGESWDDED